MNENTMIAVVVVALSTGLFGTISYKTKTDNDAKIACYEAMKYNANLVCDPNKGAVK